MVRPVLVNRVPSRRSADVATIHLGEVLYEPAWWPIVSEALGMTETTFALSACSCMVQLCCRTCVVVRRALWCGRGELAFRRVGLRGTVDPSSQAANPAE
jgi:hypothetical protein